MDICEAGPGHKRLASWVCIIYAESLPPFPADLTWTTTPPKRVCRSLLPPAIGYIADI